MMFFFCDSVLSATSQRKREKEREADRERQREEGEAHFISFSFSSKKPMKALSTNVIYILTSISICINYKERKNKFYSKQTRYNSGIDRGKSS